MKINKKNIIIIGSGISGATIANLFATNGANVTIYEQNSFIGGNCHDYINEDKILVHKYGPHIFHTSNERVMKFVNNFCKLNNFVNKVKVNLENFNQFPLPINFKSIEILFPEKKEVIIEKLKQHFPNKEIVTIIELKQINDPVLFEFVDFIYNNVYANYTSKMWGINISDITHEVISRVKISLNYNESYFPDDKYQGLPENGYTIMIANMLDHPNIKLINKHRCNLKLKNNKIFIDEKLIEDHLIFYSGKIEDILDNKYGKLPYRSLDIQFSTIDKEYFQDTAVVNYPMHPKMTRISEYKHMTLQTNINKTTISKEYPGLYNEDDLIFNAPFYPINNSQTAETYNKYLNEINNVENLFLIGRLAKYKYFDMDDAINAAMETFDSIVSKGK